MAATGVLQEEQEKQWLKGRNNFPVYKAPAPVTTKKTPGNTPQKKKKEEDTPPSATATKTLTFVQDKVHDFAWFADKRFRVLHDTLQLPSGRIVDCYAYYLPKNDAVWKNSIAYIKKALLFRSRLIGEYPYSSATVVDAAMGFPGGMEYPTITAISGKYSDGSLEGVIGHELGHNWFYGILASNERDHPWMDEGFNSYYDNRYDREQQPPAVKKKKTTGSFFIRPGRNAASFVQYA